MKRMIVELPREVQMAIRLRAVKSGMTTGEVVSEAIQRTFPEELKQSKQTLRERLVEP